MGDQKKYQPYMAVRDLIVVPSEHVTFAEPLPERATVEFRLTNRNRLKLAYAIKLTNQIDYKVVPVRGFVESGDTKSVWITRMINVTGRAADRLTIEYISVDNAVPRVDKEWFMVHQRLVRKARIILHHKQKPANN